jgi:glycosyltransferase involved in cell wall biosynthesis
MTASPEAEQGQAPLGPAWRRERAAVQDAALPAGRVTVSCPAPYGGGGLGRHLQEIVETLRRLGAEVACLCESPQVDGAAVPPPARRPGRPELLERLAPLARMHPDWRMLAVSASFDGDAARRLPAGDQVIAFNGTALAQFRAAGRRGAGECGLMSANSHITHMLARHEAAHRQYPVERPWASRLGPRNLREYELAERIWCSSAYVRDSFLARGFAAERLVPFPLTPAPRFRPAARAGAHGTFKIVYCGSLVVHKGVPLLLDAFRRVPGEELRLVLVGGWKTRAMRRFVEDACEQDRRVSAGPGDPLAHLQEADLCVHPAYEDGFAYAPAEALACGVPLIVSEDTGMKELIGPEREGLVVPSGDPGVLAEAIAAAARREILGRG